MKNAEWIALAIAGAAVYLIVKSQQPAKAKAPAKPADWVAEILDPSGGGFSNGWRYFDNGTAIDPSGNYYRDGQMIWQAAGAGA